MRHFASAQASRRPDMGWGDRVTAAAQLRKVPPGGGREVTGSREAGTANSSGLERTEPVGCHPAGWRRFGSLGQPATSKKMLA
jgi:hypothetical protein